jgi:hypothetical protein
LKLQRRPVLGVFLGMPLAPAAWSQDDVDAGLKRLAVVLEAQLARRPGALPLPWRESIVAPAKARLVWFARSLVARSAPGSFRVAVDPLTRWYFVAHARGEGAPLQFFGPLEETRKGVFVESLATSAASAPASAPGKRRGRP